MHRSDARANCRIRPGGSVARSGRWKPVNFEGLEFTESSVVRIDEDATATRLTITSDKEWAIVATLGNKGTKG
jgi:hypothetical protein